MHYLERNEESLRMYAHVMDVFKHDVKEEGKARSMYAKLMKKLGARAFKHGRYVVLGFFKKLCID